MITGSRLSRTVLAVPLSPKVRTVCNPHDHRDLSARRSAARMASTEPSTICCMYRSSTPRSPNRPPHCPMVTGASWLWVACTITRSMVLPAAATASRMMVVSS